MRRPRWHPLEVRSCLTPDPACFRVRFVEHDLGLATGLLLQVLGRALADTSVVLSSVSSSDYRTRSSSTRSILWQGRAFAPDLLEALDDVLEQLVDDAAVVAEQRTLSLMCLISTGVSAIDEPPFQ